MGAPENGNLAAQTTYLDGSSSGNAISQRVFQGGILCWLIVQNSIFTLLLRYSRIRQVDELFFPTVAVFFMEIAKLLFSTLMLSFRIGFYG